jgi:hypothetical protein
MLSIEQSLVERLPWLAQYPAIRRPVSESKVQNLRVRSCFAT